MFAHMMDQADAVMVGYRYMYSAQAGDMLRGSSVANDPAIVNFGCGSANIDKCFIAPERMSMHMHMLDLMYAPTDWLNLMLMPQFVDMDMDMRQIADPAAYAGLPPPLTNWTTSPTTSAPAIAPAASAIPACTPCSNCSARPTTTSI